MPTDRLCLVRSTVIIITCMVLSGCQLWPFSPQAEETSPETSTDGPIIDDPGPTADSVGSAMNLLQEGHEDRAEAMLERIAGESPDDPTVQLLLAQIRRPPEELLGERYEEVEVRRGESLSAIAGRTIDNELLFYSLAKLNDIEVPRLLRPGQRLKVPRIDIAEAEETIKEEPEQRPESSSPALPDSDQFEQTAQRLVDEERYSQAYALLLTAARAGKLPKTGASLLSEAAVGLSAAACREDDPERAGKYLRQAEPWLEGAAEREEFTRQQRHVEARIKLDEAEQHMSGGEESAAFDALMAMRELDAELARTHPQRLDRLETTLGNYYHDLALSAWRDQQVERSVELWDRVVKVDPDFEPAKRYLERARRAQRELEMLEED